MVRSQSRMLKTLIFVLALLGVHVVSLGQVTEAELKSRFAERFQQISRLKAQGELGETWQGYLEAVAGEAQLSDEARRLMRDENADRRELYRLIASRVEAGERRVSPEQVGQRNALRNLDNAKPNELLKVREGYWIRKRDEDRYERLSELKKEGAVGETWRGYVEAIQGSAPPAVRNVIEAENRARRELYERIAQAREIDADRVGREAAEEIRQRLQPGHSFQTQDGRWERRKPADPSDDDDQE